MAIILPIQYSRHQRKNWCLTGMEGNMDLLDPKLNPNDFVNSGQIFFSKNWRIETTSTTLIAKTQSSKLMNRRISSKARTRNTLEHVTMIIESKHIAELQGAMKTMPNMSLEKKKWKERDKNWIWEKTSWFWMMKMCKMLIRTLVELHYIHVPTLNTSRGKIINQQTVN